MAEARVGASKAECEAQVAEARAKEYSPSKAETTSHSKNIAAQALSAIPIPPPTHLEVAEALHQRSLALGIAPDQQGQVPLTPAPLVPALAPPVTLPAPVGASPGPPGVAEALHQQSLALGITPDTQGQAALAPATAALVPPPVGAIPGPTAAPLVPAMALAPLAPVFGVSPGPQEQTALAAAGSAPTAMPAATTPPVALASPQDEALFGTCFGPSSSSAP
jgi:hypothetical protein